MARRIKKSDVRPDYTKRCENCGQSPVVPMTGLCGLCHFGTEDAVGAGWWDEQDDDFDIDFYEDHM